MAEYSIWIGGLTEDVTTDMIKGEFSQRGIENMTDVHKPSGKNFGFVRFKSMAEAQTALSHVEAGGFTISGFEVQMRLAENKKNGGGKMDSMGDGALAGAASWGAAWAGGGCGKGAGMWGPYGGKGAQGPLVKPGKPAGGQKWNGEYSIWVGGLSPDTTSDELRTAANAIGVTTMSDVYCPPGKVFGFLRFADYETAFAASQLTAQGLTIRGEFKEARLSDTEKHRPDSKSGGGDGGAAAGGMGGGMGGGGGKGEEWMAGFMAAKGALMGKGMMGGMGGKGDMSSMGGKGDMSGMGGKGDWSGMGGKGDWSGMGGKGDWSGTGGKGDWSGMSGKGDWSGMGGKGDWSGMSGKGDWSGMGGVGGKGDWSGMGGKGDWSGMGGMGGKGEWMAAMMGKGGWGW